MSYEHRQMRCKGVESIFFKGKRYRPGDIIDIEVPAEFADRVEQVPEPPPPEVAEKPRYANPGRQVKPAGPPPPGDIADPFGNFKKEKK